MEDITQDQFRQALPKQVRNALKPEMVENINKVIKDSEIRESYRDNLLSYASVMATGKYKIQSYIDAVRYVSYKLMGSTNMDAYVRTFPDRYQRFITEKPAGFCISSLVTGYNKTKLVNLVYEQTLVPSHVLNADMYQKALNVQAELMVTAKSEKVRCDAANSLLVQLKMPEAHKIELDIGFREDKSIDELRQATMELVAQQRRAITSGSSDALEIAHSVITTEVGSDIIDVEIEESIKS